MTATDDRAGLPLKGEDTVGLERAVERAPVGLVVLSSDGIVTSANERARAVIGVDPAGARLDELLGVPIPQHAYTQEIERTLEGTTHAFELSWAPIDGDGWVVTIRDLTDRRQHEHGMLFEKTLLEAQTEAAFDGILVVDAKGRIISSNRRFVERVQYLYQHPGERSRDEIRLRDGRTFDRFSAPIRGEEGSPYGRVWFFHDVTDLKRGEESLRFVAEASEVLSVSLDPHGILQALARLAIPRLADWCVLYSVTDEGNIERVALEHADPAKQDIVQHIAAATLDPDATEGVPDVVRTGRPILRPYATSEMLAADVRDPSGLLEVVGELGVRSWICVPLSARGRTLGAMTFVTAESGRRYDEADLRMAEELAHRAALAMDNAKLFQERSHIARALQESLLPPSLPEIPGLSIAARYRAAGAGYEVGGDFYDVFSTGGRSWGVVIGDVLGKGPEAAALTALARYTIRAAAMRARKPARILSVLNEAIYRQHDGARFCTAVYARLQERQRGVAITVARGGHPPPVVVRADGSLEALNPSGRILGAFPAAELSQTATELFPGDTLVLYTDGVIEARSESAILGEEAFRDLLRENAGKDASSIAKAIERVVLELQEGAPRDDVALVVMQVTGAPSNQAGPPPQPRNVKRPSLRGGDREIASFEADPERIGEARTFVTQVLTGWALADLAETAVLLAHELAVNAVTHARTRFEIAVVRTESRIRIEVTDGNPTVPHKVVAAPDAPSGRGLMLIDALAAEWGIELHARGKTVWFELDLRAHAPAGV